MLYRIVIQNSTIPMRAPPRGLLGDILDKILLPYPKKRNINSRARFYFTEQGWVLYGKAVQAQATRLGFKSQVIKIKNPKKSDIVYQDYYQVAILSKKPENEKYERDF